MRRHITTQNKPRLPSILHWIIFAYALYLGYWATA